jgi:hypothetical protein
MELTSVSIHRAQASELFIRFQNRREAYIWAVNFMKAWSNDKNELEFHPFEFKDSCSWGSPVSSDSYFEVFIFKGDGFYQRNDEWYETHPCEYYEVSKEDAMNLGLYREPSQLLHPAHVGGGHPHNSGIPGS